MIRAGHRGGGEERATKCGEKCRGNQGIKSRVGSKDDKQGRRGDSDTRGSRVEQNRVEVLGSGEEGLHPPGIHLLGQDAILVGTRQRLVSLRHRNHHRRKIPRWLLKFRKIYGVLSV